MNSPLKDINILDFTHLLPGQLTTALLSDLGANILHIEPPNKTSLAHKLPPIIEGESLYFWVLHKRKSKIEIDLKAQEGKDIVYKLLEDTDVIVENFRPGVMKRLGLDWNKVKEINEKIIYCSISGYGQNNIDKHKAAHDLNLISETGLLHLNRRKGERPVLPAIPISDYMSGLLAVVSILSSLHQAKESGLGQHLDISMLDSTLSSLNILSAMSMYTNLEPEKGGFAYPRELPNYSIYECSDKRYLSVASLEPQFYKEFLTLIERLDLLDSNKSDDELIDEIATVIKQKPLSHWRDLFKESNCCVSPVNTINEALKNYPLKERNMLHVLNHPTLGDIPQMIFPVSEKLRDVERSTFSVLDSCRAYSMLLDSGYTKEEVLQLQEKGIISLYDKK